MVTECREAGLWLLSHRGPGVWLLSHRGPGVWLLSHRGLGVWLLSHRGPGVWLLSHRGLGVWLLSHRGLGVWLLNVDVEWLRRRLSLLTFIHYSGANRCYMFNTISIKLANRGITATWWCNSLGQSQLINTYIIQQSTSTFFNLTLPHCVWGAVSLGPLGHWVDSGFFHYRVLDLPMKMDPSLQPEDVVLSQAADVADSCGTLCPPTRPGKILVQQQPFWQRLLCHVLSLFAVGLPGSCGVEWEAGCHDCRIFSVLLSSLTDDCGLSQSSLALALAGVCWQPGLCVLPWTSIFAMGNLEWHPVAHFWHSAD